jgi:hypothetical protein
MRYPIQECRSSSGCTHEASVPQDVFAAALGVERLPLMEQRRLIKREKDRLLKLLHRNYAVREIVRKRWPANR